VFVDDYMTPDPTTVLPDSRLADAQKLLHENKIHHLPVVDNNGNLLGIITDRDVRSAVGYDHTLSEKLTVEEIMTAEPTTIAANAALHQALAILCNSRFGALPVTTEGRLVGIITHQDMLKAFHKVLGLDKPGKRVEIALPDLRNDLVIAFETLKSCPEAILSVVVSTMRRDGDEPALYLRFASDNTSAVERKLQDACLIVLAPERT